MDDVCALSLILPAFNEAAGIANAIAEADDALARLGITYEIIVVDDGSSDATAAIVESSKQQHPRVRLLQHGANRGYGAALRTGFTAARGERIAFTDADCQFDLDDLARLLPLTEHNPIAVGYRLDRQDSWLRKFYSRGYHWLARILLGATVRDIDCALKVFRRDALDKLLPETDGFFVNTEMLAQARQYRLTVAEAGVRHRPRRQGTSKVSVWDVPRVLNALLPFWWMKVMFPAPPEPDALARVNSPGSHTPVWEPDFGNSVSSREPSQRNGVSETPFPNGVWERGGNGAGVWRVEFAACFAAVLLAAACVLFCAGLDHSLLEPEEARYAEIPRQMLADGRVGTPVLHGEDYWQKPPLLYWLVMLSYRIFGVHDWAARLVPCLAGVFCVAITTWWGRRTLGFWTGLCSGAILTLSIRFLYLAGMVSMDGLLAACVLGGLATGHLALADDRRRTRWSLLCAVACALGILTKGPVALVLIVPPLVALAFLDRRCRFWTRREAAGYLSLIALLAGPWFLVMAWQAPVAAESFFWLHNFVRYVAPLDHEKPAWFYLPSLLLGMLPWTLLLVPALPYLWRKGRRAALRRPAPLGMFLLAFLWCLLFFSLSGCKRQGYILPAFPLLALILGTFITHGLPWRRWLESVTPDGKRWPRRLALAGCAMGGTCSAAAGLTHLLPWHWAAFLAAAFTLAACILFVAPIRRLPTWIAWGQCAAIVFVLLLVGQRAFLPAYHDRFGLRRQVEIISEYEQEEELPVLMYPKRWDSVSFYRSAGPSKSYATNELDDLIRDLQSFGNALIVVKRDGSLDEVRQRLPADMEIEWLGKDADYVAVGLVRRK